MPSPLNPGFSLKSRNAEISHTSVSDVKLPSNRFLGIWKSQPLFKGKERTAALPSEYECLLACHLVVPRQVGRSKIGSSQHVKRQRSCMFDEVEDRAWTTSECFPVEWNFAVKKWSVWKASELQATCYLSKSCWTNPNVSNAAAGTNWAALFLCVGGTA
jgi:hypothetical protein